MPYCRVRLVPKPGRPGDGNGRARSLRGPRSRATVALALLSLLGLAVLLVPPASAATPYDGVGQTGIVPHGDGGVDAKGQRQLDGFTTVLLEGVPATVCDVVLRAGEGTNITLDPPAHNVSFQRERANGTLNQSYTMYRDYVVERLRGAAGDDAADALNGSFPSNPFPDSSPPAPVTRTAAIYADAGRQGARFQVVEEWRYDARGNCTVQRTAGGVTYHDPAARPHVHLTLVPVIRDFLVDRGERHEVAFTVNNEGTIPGHLTFTASGAVAGWGFRWSDLDDGNGTDGADEGNATDGTDDGNATDGADDGNATAGDGTEASEPTITARIAPQHNVTFRFTVTVPQDAELKTLTLRLNGDLAEDDASYPLQFTYKVRKPPEEQLSSPNTDEELVKRLAREAAEQMEKARKEREAAATVVEESPGLPLTFVLVSLVLLGVMSIRRDHATTRPRHAPAPRDVAHDAASSAAAPLPVRSVMSCSLRPSMRRRRLAK